VEFQQIQEGQQIGMLFQQNNQSDGLPESVANNPNHPILQNGGTGWGFAET
jgi:hypothetical protein